MLHQATQLDNLYSGQINLWQNSFAKPKTRKICQTNSVWFTSYSLSTITPVGCSTLQVLADNELWNIFESIGIDAIHTGPIKQAGGLIKKQFTPSIDGGFDRISYKIDPLYGTEEDYHLLVEAAKKHKAIVLGDIIPGHTGLGADFQLALRNYKGYPGLYHMAEIKPDDWFLLPSVKEGELAVNLDPKTIDIFKAKGYIIGRLQHVFFYDANNKISNWSATRPIKGTDGKARRWIYLHFFKTGEPTLNWLNPTFNANRLIAGDIIHSMTQLQNSGLRLRANAFLGLESDPKTSMTWSEKHPLSIVATNQISMLIRKIGGFSFQELDATIEEIQAYGQYGPDFAYDHLTRAAYCNALINADATLLKYIYSEIQRLKLPLTRLIHAMQNHNEISYFLGHLARPKGEKVYYNDKEVEANSLRKQLMRDDLTRISGGQAPYNLISRIGPCTTMVGLCAAVLGINDLNDMTPEQKQKIKKMHLLLAYFNAMQPGVLAISGWDLVGAYPLPASEIPNWSFDNDNRWANRGAYDLMGVAPDVTKTVGNLSRVMCLYPNLSEQMKDPFSFARQLQRIIYQRKLYNVASGRLVQVLPTENKGVLALVFKLPYSGYPLLSVMNFSNKKIKETFSSHSFKNSSALNLLDSKLENKPYSSEKIKIKLSPYGKKSVLFFYKASQQGS